MYKAIIQLTSRQPEVYQSTIRQVTNLLDYFNDRVEIRIVCHGASTDFCLQLENPFSGQILALMQRGVQVLVCRNMLISNKKTENDLVTGLEVISSGMAELVIRQQEGWSYIKAGF